MEPRQLGAVGRIAIVAYVVAGSLIGATGQPAAAASAFALLWFVSYAGVGAMLAIRRPETSIGWLLLGLSFSQLLITGPWIDGPVSAFGDGSLPLLIRAYATARAAAGPLLFVLFAVLAMVLPSGRLAGGPWGRIARGGIAIGVAAVTLTAIAPEIGVNLRGFDLTVNVANPFAVLPTLPIWQVVNTDQLFVLAIPIFAGAVVSLVVRARRAAGVERQQLRWIGTSLAVVVIAIVIGFAISALVPGGSESGLTWVPAILAVPLVPLAIGVAVLRYRLYNIDTLINRAIVYGLLTAILAGASAAGIAVTQRLFSGAVGPGSDITLVFITLAVVAAFNPIKTQLQAVVDRRFNEVRDPQKALASFVADVHASFSRPDRDRTLQRFLEAAVLAFGASDGEIRLHRNGRLRSFQAAGQGPGRDLGADQVRASAASSGLEAEIRLSGIEGSRGSAALEPALAAVLREVNPG